MISLISAEFEVIDPARIIVGERQRSELTDIQTLADSIKRIGLIHPIVVDRDYVLISGERRLTAVLSIGLNPITIQFADSLDPSTRHLIELEENVKRKDLSWKDYVKSVIDYHNIRLGAAEGQWEIINTATDLGISAQHTGKCLLVSSLIEHEMVADCDKFSTAYNVAQRIKERRAASATKEIGEEIGRTLDTAAEGFERHEKEGDGDGSSHISNEDFIPWARSYSGDRFNLIHCDFPYGIGVGDKSGQSARKKTGGFEDTPEVYENLIEQFTDNSERFIDQSAHLIFWFPMDRYQYTLETLEVNWRVNPYPLIWHKSDNTGILPDPNRGPRRTYETAFFASRGDRKIVRAVANSIGAVSTREFHTSEKPRPVLTHFMRMLVDETTRMFDPTAGSGNAVRVAAELGAATCLGLEINREFAEAACKNILRK